MANFYLLCLTTLFIFGNIGKSYSCHPNPEPIAEDLLPRVVKIFEEGRRICNGIDIGDGRILTAAQCLFRDTRSDLSTKLNRRDQISIRDESGNEIDLSHQSLMHHDGYHMSGQVMMYDLALANASDDSVSLEDPIAIPRGSNHVNTNDTCHVFSDKGRVSVKLSGCRDVVVYANRFYKRRQATMCIEIPDGGNEQLISGSPVICREDPTVDAYYIRGLIVGKKNGHKFRNQRYILASIPSTIRMYE